MTDKRKTKNGWHRSQIHQLIHYIKNGKYLCNEAVKPKIFKGIISVHALIDNETCKNCLKHFNCDGKLQI